LSYAHEVITMRKMNAAQKQLKNDIFNNRWGISPRVSGDAFSVGYAKAGGTINGNVVRQNESGMHCERLDSDTGVGFACTNNLIFNNTQNGMQLHPMLRGALRLSLPRIS